MTRNIRAERGSAIVLAIALMTMMLAVGLAAYSFVDTQQENSMQERHRESSFNLAEAVLNEQSFTLSRRWAGSSTAYASTVPTCTNGSAPAIQCPDVSQLAGTYNSPDYATGATWKTTIYDDPSGSPFYDASLVEAATNSHWDANGNLRVWVKAESSVRGRRRVLVALVQVQKHTEFLPKRVIIAGHFELTPNGNHKYVLTNPDTTSQHQVTLRCTLAVSGCAAYTLDKKNPQIDPQGAIEGDSYVGKDALEDDVKDRLKERAIADGTYFNGTCPTDDQLNGKVVWVEGCASGQYTKNNIWNSATAPGILIWADGTLEMGGNSTFYGIIYHLNNSNSTDNVLRLRGGLTVQGGTFVDGPGGIDVGSNSVNVNYNENAFTSIDSYGSASIVQNSWRDITGSS